MLHEMSYKENLEHYFNINKKIYNNLLDYDVVAADLFSIQVDELDLNSLEDTNKYLFLFDKNMEILRSVNDPSVEEIDSLIEKLQ